MEEGAAPWCRVGAAVQWSEGLRLQSNNRFTFLVCFIAVSVLHYLHSPWIYIRLRSGCASGLNFRAVLWTSDSEDGPEFRILTLNG